MPSSRRLLALGSMEGVRVLLPRADIAAKVIGEQLRDAGAIVTEVIALSHDSRRRASGSDPDIYGMLLEGASTSPRSRVLQRFETSPKSTARTRSPTC